MIPMGYLFFFAMQTIVIPAAFSMSSWRWKIGSLLGLEALVILFAAPMIPGLVRFS